MAGRRGRVSRSKFQSYKTIGVGIVVLLVVGASLYLWAESAPSDSGRLAIDWRLNLIIHDSRNGLNYTLPAGIGVVPDLWVNHTLDQYGPPGYAPVSTRDGTGTIYIQSPKGVFDGTTIVLRFSFGDFFNIWGQRFDRNCVPDGRGGLYCGGEGWPDPAPIMVDANNDEARCVSRVPNLSHGKTWLIYLGVTNPELNCN